MEHRPPCSEARSWRSGFVWGKHPSQGILYVLTLQHPALQPHNTLSLSATLIPSSSSFSFSFLSHRLLPLSYFISSLAPLSYSLLSSPLLTSHLCSSSLGSKTLLSLSPHLLDRVQGSCVELFPRKPSNKRSAACYQQASNMAAVAAAAASQRLGWASWALRSGLFRNRQAQVCM